MIEIQDDYPTEIVLWDESDHYLRLAPHEIEPLTEELANILQRWRDRDLIGGKP